jgi:hypothetical protein
MIRIAGDTALLAVATVVLWWAVFPADRSLVPTRDP